MVNILTEVQRKNLPDSKNIVHVVEKEERQPLSKTDDHVKHIFWEHRKPITGPTWEDRGKISSTDAVVLKHGRR